MVGKRPFAVILGISVAFACDGKRSADDDDDETAGEGGESAAPASGGKGGGKGGASGAAGKSSGGSAGSAARGGDGSGESGAPASGGAGGSTGGGGTGGDVSSGGSGDASGNGGTAGDGAMGGGGGDAGSGGSLGGTGGGSGTGGAAGASAGTGGGAGGTAGKGGTAGTGGAAGAGACGNLIDDMEAGTGYVCQGNGRTGSWFSYVSTYGTFAPAGYPVPTTLLAAPRGSSTRAMRAYGTNDDYAGFGCWLTTTPATYDASAYTGLRFYAMGTPPGLRVIVQTSGTESTTYGGDCVLPTLECAGNETSVSITASWALYQVTFSSLVGGTVAFDPSDIWSIEFQPATVGTYDFYIDDLSFY